MSDDIDIVDRLRIAWTSMTEMGNAERKEAADEIERLRAELVRMTDELTLACGAGSSPCWIVSPQVDGADRVYWIVRSDERRMGWAFDRESDARECAAELNRYRDALVAIRENANDEPYSAEAAEDAIKGRSIR